MRKFRPLQEPIRLQDLFNSASSRAEKWQNTFLETTKNCALQIQRKNQVFVNHVLESPSPRILESQRFSVPRPRVLAAPCPRPPESSHPASSSPNVFASHVPAFLRPRVSVPPSPCIPRPRVSRPRGPMFHVPVPRLVTAGMYTALRL